LPHSYLLGGALEWDQDDRDKLMAFLLEQGDYCSMCGTHGWEWEEDPYAYEATISYCKGCAIKDMSQEEADKPGASVLLLPAAEAARLRAKPKQAPRRRDRG
jgi:hypothetical protein